MVWIGGAENAWEPAQPVPLVLFEAPCVFRKAGIEALDAAGIPWRITFTSPSLAGLWAAVDAGLGISRERRQTCRNPSRRSAGRIGFQSCHASIFRFMMAAGR